MINQKEYQGLKKNYARRRAEAKEHAEANQYECYFLIKAEGNTISQEFIARQTGLAYILVGNYHILAIELPEDDTLLSKNEGVSVRNKSPL